MLTQENETLDFVIETWSGSERMGGALDKVTESTRTMIERAKSAVVQMGAEFGEAINKIPVQCEYVDVKFGIKFDAEAGVVISRVGTQASLEVTLRLKPVAAVQTAP